MEAALESIRARGRQLRGAVTRRPRAARVLGIGGVVCIGLLASVCRPAPTRCYYVTTGDTGWRISRNLGISCSELERVNPGVDWTRLEVDQRLKIPDLGPARRLFERRRFHTVQRGETALRIAAEQGVPFREVVRMNPGVNFGRIRPGDEIALPVEPLLQWLSRDKRPDAVETVRLPRPLGPKGSGVTPQHDPSRPVLGERQLPAPPPTDERVEPRGPAGHHVTDVIVIYSGDRLSTLNPQILSSSGRVVLDDIVISGRILMTAVDLPEARSLSGGAPLEVRGRSVSDVSIALGRSGVHAVEDAMRNEGPNDLPVILVWEG